MVGNLRSVTSSKPDSGARGPMMCRGRICFLVAMLALGGVCVWLCGQAEVFARPGKNEHVTSTEEDIRYGWAKGKPESGKAEFSGDVMMEFSGRSFLGWLETEIDGKVCRVSPGIKSPAGFEMNHHRVTVDFSGGGSVEISVAHSVRDNMNEAINEQRLHSRFRPVRSGEEIRVTSRRRSERFAWVAVHTVGKVTIGRIRHVCRRGRGTIEGHVARRFEFEGSILPYRLMSPRNYDRRKTYPLVLSVSGSGGVGADNARNMENVVLARYLFLNYFFNEQFECFSIVPQIPPDSAIPAPYWPKGELGKPTPPYHPGSAAVNEKGWYVQATLALIRELIQDERFNIDADRVYCSGFSYGGKACWEFLKAAPDVFAAALCGSGWPIGTPYSDPGNRPDLLRQLKAEVQRYKHVPVHIFAGDQDAMRFGSRAVHKELVAQGADSTYVEFPNTKHVTAAAKAWGNQKHLAWLFTQKRSTPPKGEDIIRDEKLPTDLLLRGKN